MTAEDINKLAQRLAQALGGYASPEATKQIILSILTRELQAVP